MPDDLAQQAARAIKAAIEAAGGTAAFARFHSIAERTAERIETGAQPVAPGLAREVAASFDHVSSRRAPEHAATLRAWADQVEATNA